MSIRYDKLFALMEQKGIKKNHLRTHKEHRIYSRVIERMQEGGAVDTKTINKLCVILDCQPGDILEYVPDNPTPEEIAYRESVWGRSDD